MTPTDCAVHVPTFWTHDVAAQRHLRPQTIQASREVFPLLRRSGRDVRGMALEQRSLAQSAVAWGEAVLQALAHERLAAIGTRHQRRAALHAFCRSVQAAPPPSLWPCQPRLALPRRRDARPPVGSLSQDLVAALWAPPALHPRDGRRAAGFLRGLYDTGARVQEVIARSASAGRWDPPHRSL